MVAAPGTTVVGTQNPMPCCRAGWNVLHHFTKIIISHSAAWLADAILDRLVHNAYRLELNGESLRKAKANLNLNSKPPTDKP